MTIQWVINMLTNNFMLKIKFEIFIRESLYYIVYFIYYAVGPMIGYFAQLSTILGLNSKSLKWIMWAHRVSYSKKSLSFIVDLVCEQKNEQIMKSLISEPASLKHVAGRIIIVRWPDIENDTVASKGILIVTFTSTFSFFHKEVDVSRLEKYFHIVLEPSWAGYCDVDILNWVYTSSNPIFIQASEVLDRSFINLLGKKFIPISIGASDWVDYKVFYPLSPVNKIYDSVYVANTTRMKRVHRYLQAISEIKNKFKNDYRGALVCAEWGGRAAEVQEFHNYYGLGESCDLYFQLNHDKLREILSNSKVNILLSQKEGSNRSLFEAMFCNTPAICIVENIGVNKSYINEFTGLLTWDAFLPESLLAMKDKWYMYRPREWAMENISPEVTMEKLCRTIAYSVNDEIILNDLKQKKNIYYKVNRPEVEYLNYPSFDKYEFNSKLLSIFLKSYSDSDVHAKLSELKVVFDSCIGEGQ